MAVLIRNFGKDTKCLTLKDFKAALIQKYKLMSVTIEHKLDLPMKKIEFVDVLADGSLINSHSELPVPFDFFVFKEC